MKLAPTLSFGIALLGAGLAFAQTATPPAPPADAAPAARPDRPDRGARIFELIDVNRDGRITSDEVWVFVTGRFTAADADRSGGLSLQEFATLRPGLAPANRPAPPALPPEALARMEQMRGGMFRALDANRDGQVTLEEIRPAVEARFRAADANGDNVVTREELPRGGRHGHHGRGGPMGGPGGMMGGPGPR